MAEKDFDRGYPVGKKDITYDEEIRRAQEARHTQKNDTNPYMEKEGFLGVDDIDRIRRKKLKHETT